MRRKDLCFALIRLDQKALGKLYFSTHFNHKTLTIMRYHEVHMKMKYK